MGDRLGEQRLARPGGSVEEDALRDLGAEVTEALGVAKIVDDLAQLLLGLVGAGDVRPADRGRVLGLDLDRLGLRHVPHQREHSDHEQAHEQDGQPVEHERLDVGLPEEVRERHGTNGCHRQTPAFTQPSEVADSASTSVRLWRRVFRRPSRCPRCSRCPRGSATSRRRTHRLEPRRLRTPGSAPP